MSPRIALVTLAAACFIMAPTPGSVGACGGDDLSDPADFQSYCEERGQLVCVRRFLRRELTERERDACRWKAVDDCARRTFPSDCHPTERRAQACLNALSSFDTLETKESEIAECNTEALCDAPPSAAGADAGAGS